MSLRLTLIILSCVSLSACATINLDEMAANNEAAKSSVVSINVVQRAAAKLYALFTNKGLVAADSQKRVQSAASILLKGLDQKNIISAEAGYVSKTLDSKVILEDIMTASRYVEQTTKAAEVYLAIAPSDKNMRDELNSLEDALLASRIAETAFKEALINTGQVRSETEILIYSQNLNALKDITNAFGDRVRDRHLETEDILN